MKRLALAAPLVVLPLLVRSVLAAPPQSPITVKARTISFVTEVTDTSLQVTTSTDWTDLAGATATISIPANWGSGLIMARFSAMAGMTNGGFGTVRILIGGIEGNPAGGATYQFAAADFLNEVDAHSMDRSLVLAPGTYTVQVQFADGPPTNTEFDISDWSLTVETARAS